jgi:lysophospholipid acyltransferase (LPLAT)-like uncharacterized protein
VHSPHPTPQIVIPHRARWHQRFLSLVIVTVAKAMMWTWRVKWNDHSGAFDGEQGPVIFCTWHNRLSVSMLVWRMYVSRKRPANGLVALISASKDGGLLADVLASFEVRAVRGSSSRRGRQALLEATTWIEKGYHVAITPDGPRGPCYHLQDGVVALAQLTGLPIIPVSSLITPKFRTKSWDRFQIPLPFSRCEVRIGKPICIPRDATDEERDRLKAELQRTMMEMTED